MKITIAYVTKKYKQKTKMAYLKKFFIFFLILLVSISMISCGNKECKEDSDCSAQKCFDVSCVKGMCEKEIQFDCCGNLQCEDGENTCSCNLDCKKPKCEGPVAVGEVRGKTISGQYLEYMCVEDKCMMSFDETNVKKIPLVSEKTISGVDLDLGITFNKPFGLIDDKIMVSISLKDYDDSKVKLPFVIKSIKILDNKLLYGELNVNKQLTQLGSGVKELVPLTFIPEEKEKEIALTLKIDYELGKINTKGEEEILRESFTEKFSQKMFLVVTGESDLK